MGSSRLSAQKQRVNKNSKAGLQDILIKGKHLTDLIKNVIWKHNNITLVLCQMSVQQK